MQETGEKRFFCAFSFKLIYHDACKFPSGTWFCHSETLLTWRFKADFPLCKQINSGLKAL